MNKWKDVLRLIEKREILINEWIGVMRFLEKWTDTDE